MWKGKVTEELIKLHNQYLKKYGMEPDEFAEIFYDGMSYDEYVGYIKECLEKDLEIPDVVK